MNRLIIQHIVLSAVLALTTFAAEEKSTNSPALTLDRLFEGEEFAGETFGSIVWAKSGRGYFKMEKADAPRKNQDLVYFDCTHTNKEIVVPSHALTIPGSWSPLSVESFSLSEDESRALLFTNSKRVWRQNTRGDYWVLDLTGRDLRKLGGAAPESSLMFARFSPDGKRVAYVRENNIYVEDAVSGLIVQVTRDGSKTIINGTSDWVYEEELFLRDAFRWSPDNRSLAYWQFDTSGVPEFSLVSYTEGMYPRELKFPYPKTGHQNASGRVGVVGAGGGETRWLTIPGDPRNNYLSQMFWASNSTELLIQQFNRPQNTNTFYLAQVATAETREFMIDRDEAWVEFENDARWIENGNSLLWLSERSGWRHLYKMLSKGGPVIPVTEGEFDVIRVVAWDAKRGLIYFEASPKSAAEKFLFSVEADGKNIRRITPDDQSGTHSYNVSPTGDFAVHIRSTASQPPVAEIIELPGHRSIRNVEANKKLIEKVAALHRPAVEFGRVEIEQNVELDTWLIKPPSFNPETKYPLLIYVYGEPHGQTVRDHWGGKTHLWHWMLAQRGIVVASIDNRGVLSARGRDFRKSVYRQVGLLASSDQAQAVRALLQKHSYLDPERVGVWGWSGGGSMSLNAILRYPDLYKTAIAVASVPNQRLYDTIYQERYMGVPWNNPEGYRRGSPLNYASQLKGNLLLIHGTADDNVHHQGMEALVNEFVAYNKQFSMMVYPNRTHSINEGQNTTRHLFTAMTSYLEKHLRPAPPIEGHIPITAPKP